jgi:anaerobic selenocysteine-containing dehydrogenase
MEYRTDKGKPWRWEEGEKTVTRTVAWSAPGCHPVGCGVKLYVNEEGILERVEGDENHPVTQGRLCVRCLTLPDFVYHKDRIVYPMKRAREDRGKDKWERISYDEAYEIIAKEVAKVKEEYGAESIAVYGGTGRQGGPMTVHFAHRVLGTPNACYCMSGYSCYSPRLASTSYVLGYPYPEIDYAGGLPGRYDDPLFKLPEVIVIWGKEPLPSNPDGLFGHAVIDMMKRGSKLIMVDPRQCWLATRADIHLQLRPGTDTALAMAMLNIIISEKLYDEDFVDRFCYGFNEFAERMTTMSPEKAAEICGIDVEDVYAAARLFGKAKPASICWGLATDQKSNGVQMGHSLLALMAISGNIDVPGGQVLADPSDGLKDEVSGGYGWNTLGKELQEKIIGLKEYPAYVTMILNSQADLMLEALETDKPYPIKLGFIQSTNMLAGTCAAQPQRWYQALKRLDFVFAADVWVTPTVMALADVFLPLSSYAEQDTVLSTHYNASPNYFGAVNKAITVGDTRSDIELMLELGRKINPDAWSMYNDIYDLLDDYRLGSLMSFDDLRKKVVVQRNVSYRKFESGKLRPDGQPGFNTPTGRVELYSTIYEHFGDDPLPYYEEPQYSPVSTPELCEEYPFILTTGARTYAYFHSEGKQIPLLRELNPDPLIEINPKSAEKLGILDGEWVNVENQFGRCLLKAKVTPIVKEDVVMAQHGFWFPEENAEDPHLYGVWRSNVNNLIPHKHIGKLGFGSPFKCMICKVTKVNICEVK